MCRYIDHFSCDKKDLGIFYKAVPPLNGVHSILSTCHRIEVINVTNDDELPNFKIDKYTSKQLSGVKDVCSRLAKIACGVDSVILGEPFVFKQVKNAFKYDTTDTAIFQTVQMSLDIAKRTKRKYDFYSRYDYSDIAIKFLDEWKNVVIIGSGMLAETLSNKIDNSLIVTRNLKSAKKKFKRVVKINHIPNTPFKCIIATTSNSKYKRAINKGLINSNCLLAVDLSAIPFLDQPKFKYITMYDKEFEKEIEMINSELLSKVELVKNDIDDQINKMFK